MGTSSYSNKKKSTSFIGPIPIDMSEYDNIVVDYVDPKSEKYDDNNKKIYSLDDILIEYYSYTTTGKRMGVEKQYAYPVKKEDLDKLSVINDDKLLDDYLSQFKDIDYDNAYEMKQNLSYYHDFYIFITEENIKLEPELLDRLTKIENKYQFVSTNYPTQQEAYESLQSYLENEKQKKMDELLYLWICLNNPQINSKIFSSNHNMEMSFYDFSQYYNYGNYNSILGRTGDYNFIPPQQQGDFSSILPELDAQVKKMNDPVLNYFNDYGSPYSFDGRVYEKIKEMYPELDLQFNYPFFDITPKIETPEGIKEILVRSNIPIEYMDEFADEKGNVDIRSIVREKLDAAHLSGSITSDELQDVLIYIDQLKTGKFNKTALENDTHQGYEITKYDQYAIDFNPQEFLATHDIYGMDLTKFNISDLENRKNELLDELQVDDYYLYQLKEGSKQTPYLDLANTNKFKNFIDSNQEKEANSLLLFDYLSGAINTDKEKYYEILENEGYDKAFEYLQDAVTSYVSSYANRVTYDTKYMTEDQQKILFYLLETDGYDAALEYRELISDSINQARGAEEAYKFIDSLSTMSDGDIKKTVGNFFKVSGQGLEDGLETYCNGLEEAFRNNATLTADDYKVSIIMSYLSEHSNYYDEVYEFSSSMGNMLPTIAISAIGTLGGCPELGYVFKGISLTGMATSSFGNAKHQALVQGYDVYSSVVYGLFSSINEVGMEALLGTIPGIGKTSNSFMKDIFKEGFEELVQSYVDTGLRAGILGEEVDFTNMEKDGVKSFAYGMLMSLCFNGGSRVINFTYGTMSGKIDAVEFVNTVTNNPNISIEQILNMYSVTYNPSDVTSNNYSFKVSDEGDSLIVSPSLDATSVNIRMDILDGLLKDDSVLEKFLNYDLNTDYFRPGLKEYYITGAQQYVNYLIKNNIEITPDMQERLNTIISQTAKVTSFDDFRIRQVLNQVHNNFMLDSYMYDCLGTPTYTFYSTIDNVIFDDDAYFAYLQQIKNASTNMEKYNLTVAYAALYDDVKKNGLILDSMYETRLNHLSTLCDEALNARRSQFSQYSEYGANQGCIRSLASNPMKNVQIYNQMFGIARSYFPNMSPANLTKLFNAIDVKGICSYATVANEIYSYYDGKEVQFRQDFGYDMYRMENGVKVLNDELLLMDLFCYANKYNHKMIKHPYAKVFAGIAKNDKNQAYMSLFDARKPKNLYAINTFLREKGLSTTFNSSILYMTNTGTSVDTIKDINSKIQSAILENHTIELDVFSNNSAKMNLILYPTNPTIQPYVLNGEHAYGHSMMVTGLTENGDIIVSTWGMECVIKWSDLINVDILINDSYIN